MPSGDLSRCRPAPRLAAMSAPATSRLDLKGELFWIAGVDLTDVPGISAITAHTIIMKSVMTCRAFEMPRLSPPSWGSVRRNRSAAVRSFSTRSRKVKNRAAIALRHGAHCFYHAKNYLGAFTAR